MPRTNTEPEESGFSFPAEAVLVAIGAALRYTVKGTILEVPDRLLDDEGNAWTANVDRRAGNVVILSRRRNWTQESDVCHWRVPMAQFNDCKLEAEAFEMRVA